MTIKNTVDPSWELRLDAFWREADDSHPDQLWSTLEALLAERPATDAVAHYERASLHDLLEEEEAAVPLYQAALAGGLDGDRRDCALIQLASSLRNIGQVEAAAEILDPLQSDPSIGLAARAFLSLALHDLGRHGEALSLALTDLAPSVPLYGRALGAYARLLAPQRE